MNSLLVDDTSTPAVVYGCHRHNGLNVTRTLGRLGVPVYAIDADPHTPAFFSKYCHDKFVWDLDGAQEQENVRFLENLGEKIGRRSVLIPTSDTGSRFVAKHADCLRKSFMFPECDTGLVRALCSKKELYSLARSCGVPTPETVFPQSREDVVEYLKVARFPVLLKAIHGTLTERAGKPYFLTHSESELLERYDTIEDSSQPNLLLQEYVPGGDDATWMFNGYFDKNGECNVAFTGRKLRNWPPYFGQASLAECIKNDEVEKMTVSFMRTVGYKGALDLGYRYDARDGRYKIFDVNPRVGSTFRLFVGTNGMDVVRALYQDLTGQPVVASSTVNGRKWIVEHYDLRSSIRYYRDGKLSLRDWVKSLRGIDEGTYIKIDDPWPIASAVMLASKRFLKSGRR